MATYWTELKQSLFFEGEERMSDFKRILPANDELFDVFIRVANQPSMLVTWQHSNLQAFNTAYFLATLVSNTHDEGNEINSLIDETEEIWGVNSAPLLLGLVYAILSLQNQPTEACRYFLRTLENHPRMKQSNAFWAFKEFIATHQERYTIDLSPRPDPVEALSASSNVWEEETHFYREGTIWGMLHVYRKKEERLKLLNLIKKTCRQSYETSLNSGDVIPLKTWEEKSALFVRLKHKVEAEPDETPKKEKRPDMPTSAHTATPNPTEAENEYLHKENEALKQQVETLAKENEECKKREMLHKPQRKEKGGFATLVVNPACADAVMQMLHKMMKNKTTPKDIVMPIRAAMDAGVISRPTWGQFCQEFGEDRIRSRSGLNNYTNPDNKPYEGEAYQNMMKMFHSLCESS